jgi:hypothetical protein
MWTQAKKLQEEQIKELQTLSGSKYPDLFKS